MSTVARDLIDPMSSGEIQLADPKRLIDVERKHRSVTDFLKSRRYDALLLTDPLNFAWFTSGGDSSRGGSGEAMAALFITPEARVVATTNINTGQLFDHEIPGMGFQLKERPWNEPRTALLDDLCRGRTVASDSGYPQTRDVSTELTRMRLPLTAVECERAHEVGRRVAHAVEATARSCASGQTEAEIAAEVAHRLIKHEVQIERIQVCADGDRRRYPHWSYGPKPVAKYVSISAVGRRLGLCAAATRTVAFEETPNELRQAYNRAALLHATGMYFSRPDMTLSDIWERVQRIFEKYGCPGDWQSTDQAEITGYFATEIAFVPKSDLHPSARMPIHWHPRVGPAICGDTILTTEDEFELLTPTESWPRLSIDVKGQRVQCPDILLRVS